MMPTRPAAPASILGLALTLDFTCREIVGTLSTIRARPGVELDEPRPPFVALVLETTDARADHAWLESLPGVVAVDVVFVEVLPEVAGTPRGGHARRHSRDPLDDSPLPDTRAASMARHPGGPSQSATSPLPCDDPAAVTSADPDFLAF